MDKSSTVRQDLIRALVSVLSFGIQENELDDADQLLAGIKALSPGLLGIEEFYSYIAIKRGFIREALQMYTSTPSEDSKWYVMMALCLKLAGDPTWHWHATQSLEKTDASSQYAHDLARILLGQNATAQADEPKSGYKPDTQAAADFAASYAGYLAV